MEVDLRWLYTVTGLRRCRHRAALLARLRFCHHLVLKLAADRQVDRVHRRRRRRARDRQSAGAVPRADLNNRASAHLAGEVREQFVVLGASGLRGELGVVGARPVYQRRDRRIADVGAVDADVGRRFDAWFAATWARFVAAAAATRRGTSHRHVRCSAAQAAIGALAHEACGFWHVFASLGTSPLPVDSAPSPCTTHACRTTRPLSCPEIAPRNKRFGFPQVSLIFLPCPQVRPQRGQGDLRPRHRR